MPIVFDELRPQLIGLFVAQSPLFAMPVASRNTMRQLMEQYLALHFFGFAFFYFNYPFVALSIDLPTCAIGQLLSPNGQSLYVFLNKLSEVYEQKHFRRARSWA
ncbi:MAG: hypothetical protein ACLP9L_28385 [Thermoguttaceae bacterium]